MTTEQYHASFIFEKEGLGMNVGWESTHVNVEDKICRDGMVNNMVSRATYIPHRSILFSDRRC